ncbi:MAG: helix-turn-helix domain-containing protein [Candidatus Electryonea clarkiae]|nr:helix-turn-helix domain-containing protein [Candidatus Electryonea clarkiae]
MTYDETIGHLTALGLSNNESKIYITMLGRGSFTATEASTASGVPRQMIYRILTRLLERGLCIETSSNPRMFLISDPRSNLYNLVEKEKRRVKSFDAFLPKIFEQYQMMQENHNPLEIVSIIKDRRLAYTTHLKLQAEAERELLYFIRGPYQDSGKGAPPRKYAEETLENQIKEASQNKRVVKALYQLEKGNPVLADLIERSVMESGEQARLIDYIPIKAAIYDGRKVLLFLPSQDNETSFILTTLLIEHEEFAETMRTTFDSYWQLGIDFNDWMQLSK